MPLFGFLASGPSGKLHAAAARGDAAAVRKLLAGGKHPDKLSKDSSSSCALALAAAAGHLGAVDALLEGGANVNQRDGGNDTPLLAAVAAGQVAAAQRLLQAGADPTAAGANHLTCLHKAAAEGQAALVPLLVRAGAALEARAGGGRTPLHVAMQAGSAPAVAALLAAGAAPDSLDSSKLAPLLLAAQWGRVEAIQALVQGGAALLPPACGTTPFHQAAACNQAAAIHALAAAARQLDLTEGPAARNGAGRTALHVAASSAAPDAAAALLRLGAEVDARDRQCQTPLHRVAKCWDREHAEACLGVVEALLEAGADPEAQDKKEASPLSLASARHLEKLAGRLHKAVGKRQEARGALAGWGIPERQRWGVPGGCVGLPAGWLRAGGGGRRVEGGGALSVAWGPLCFACTSMLACSSSGCCLRLLRASTAWSAPDPSMHTHTHTHTAPHLPLPCSPLQGSSGTCLPRQPGGRAGRPGRRRQGRRRGAAHGRQPGRHPAAHGGIRRPRGAVPGPGVFRGRRGGARLGRPHAPARRGRQEPGAAAPRVGRGAGGHDPGAAGGGRRRRGRRRRRAHAAHGGSCGGRGHGGQGPGQGGGQPGGVHACWAHRTAPGRRRAQVVGCGGAARGRGQPCCGRP